MAGVQCCEGVLFNPASLGSEAWTDLRHAGLSIGIWRGSPPTRDSQPPIPG
jgi:hypothetical protein